MDILSGELFSAAAAVAGSLGVHGLVRAYLRHRTRLHRERELSARARTRTQGLIRLAECHEAVLIDERDEDGHRVIRLHAVDGETGAHDRNEAA